MAAVAQFRLAARADAAQIALMSREFIEYGLPWSWTGERVLHAIADRSSNVVLAAGRSGVLGFGIMHYGDAHAHLALLAVQPAHRQQGWGGRLLNWLLEPARSLGLLRVLVEARADNPRAIAFYERHGFSRRATVAGYYRGAIDAVRLERPLCESRGDPMTTPVQIEGAGGIGVYRLEGPMPLEQAIAQGTTAIVIARAQQLDRLLILAQGLELPAVPTVLDRYRIGERWAAAAGGAMYVAVVALTVAMNRGAKAHVFDSEPAARAWLARQGRSGPA
ncbi:MAG TPA: GNAT family N-acetyltransferase [Steroidobacteraceae bacterium]|nr:GNAT family N-acetyltransferase [Steroidobacteraceae bacterium]